MCDCGNIRTLHTGNLRSGNTKSCGCLSAEVKRAKRISLNHSEITAVIMGYKRHAARRGLLWELTREQAEELIKAPCIYCGVAWSNVKTTKNTIVPLRYNGIDRANNDVGYIYSNVVSCCKVCNKAKLDMSLEEFKSWACRLGAMAEQWSKYIES